MRAKEFQPNKLVIFDIDDTLVHTQTKVHVVRDGEVTKELNSHEFTLYKLQPGEKFDFENFRNAQEFFNNSKPIIPMMNQLKNDIATGNKVVMVTARADFDDRELFLDTFRKYGVDMSRVHVYRAGNMTGKMQTEEKKKIIIRKLLDKGNYTKAIMYDDAVPNLESFVELKDEYANTKFYAWHVSLEGEASEYQRTNESQTLAERKKKRKSCWAAYGPGLYGGYGYFSTYGNSDSTGDGGGDGGGESIRENITPNTIHKLADRKGVKWDNEPSFLQLTKRLTGKEHLDDLDQTGLNKVKQHLEKQGVAEGKITLSTDPNWYGATVDNYQASGPVVNIPANQLVGFEPDDKMNQPKSKANVKKIVAGLKQGDKLPPLLVRKYKDGYQVLDGHHRFWAYKLLGVKSIPAQIVPAKDIEEISKQGVAENFADGKNPQDKGDSKRHGVPTKASVSTLRKVAKQGGRKGQLAHWMANMKAGKAK
jgi:hypothetical protein